MIWNIAKVVAETTLSKCTIYRLIKEGKFPRQIKISRLRVGWKKSDVEAFLDAMCKGGK